MTWVSHSVRPHSATIAAAFVATLLVIYGNDLNRGVRKLLRKFSFGVRVALFILICAFGYGYVSVILARLVHRGLASLGDVQFVLLVVSAFFLVGFLAEHKKQL